MSEANGQKFLKNAKNGQSNQEAYSQKVLQDRLIGQKMVENAIQMRHFR